VKKKSRALAISPAASGKYRGLIGGIAELLETARHSAARTGNAFMTATYWEIGRRIVEFEQGGEKRAEYGEALLARLADDLTARFGRGFSRQNLQRFRQFYLSQPVEKICSTLSSKSVGGNRPTPSSICQTPSGKSRPKNSATVSRKSEALIRNFALSDLARVFPLPWSHYVLLLSRSPVKARRR
jgi:hypothetical protein